MFDATGVDATGVDATGVDATGVDADAPGGTETGPAPTRVEILGGIGPNWFASVMGTGIVANAGATLPIHLLGPIHFPGLYTFTRVVWVFAALLLVVLLVLLLPPVLLVVLLVLLLPLVHHTEHYGDPHRHHLLPEW